MMATNISFKTFYTHKYQTGWSPDHPEEILRICRVWSHIKTHSMNSGGMLLSFKYSFFMTSFTFSPVNLFDCNLDFCVTKVCVTLFESSHKIHCGYDVKKLDHYFFHASVTDEHSAALV